MRKVGGKSNQNLIDGKGTKDEKSMRIIQNSHNF